MAVHPSQLEPVDLLNSTEEDPSRDLIHSDNASVVQLDSSVESVLLGDQNDDLLDLGRSVLMDDVSNMNLKLFPWCI